MERFILLIVSLSLVISCYGQQTVPVRFQYEETDSPASSLIIKLSGELQGTTYRIRMAHYTNGSVSYKILNEQPSIVTDTVLSIHISAEPLHAHEVNFIIEGDKSIVEKAEVDDVLHSILMETYSDKPYTSTDTIPLAGYTSGALREVMINGELQQGGSYCDVRDAALSPPKWHEAFNMKEYIWFDLIFE